MKTTVPTGLIAVETVSSVFGRTTNPYNSAFSAGASTGGGGALLACGGSKIEIGTDLAGSVRVPAHFCGVWSLKGSSGRFPTWGTESSMNGLEPIPIVAAPMASNLNDLQDFWKRVVASEPWQYDHTVSFLPPPFFPFTLNDIMWMFSVFHFLGEMLIFRTKGVSWNGALCGKMVRIEAL